MKKNVIFFFVALVMFILFLRFVFYKNVDLEFIIEAVCIVLIATFVKVGIESIVRKYS